MLSDGGGDGAMLLESGSLDVVADVVGDGCTPSTA